MASKTGHCLCGAVTYELAEVPTTYGACHCGMCRRWAGGIELGVQVPAGGITWTGADPATFKSSDWAERGFCGTCGASLFWRLIADGSMKGMMSLSVGTLDDMDGLAFETEIFIDHKPGSHAFAGDRKRMTEADVMAMMNAEGGA